ncbi:CaiB/BaiF CoA transferase family protein [Sphingorhabdus lacus]|uniref:CoA transferase n=1 Tax=Sphingorhabdus lacus TaxID=392610 RepID=A0A6I6L1V2_9SPHN|nr:CaiB/BaiF CoA-transferase family protein [Sphingorhabdus lacus]QGY79590.1 CoA transferase [Sphingorhabdus lacus]
MTDSPAKTGPLAGIMVIELAGIGPGPYAGQLLADMGADVVVIDRPGRSLPKAVDGRGKKSIVLDLKKPEAVEALLKLVAKADVLIEGLRPGVTERMGVGPEACHAINPGLIYGRMTGWGQSGPWSQMAGHDINYISMTGVLNAIGKKGQPPVPPLNMVGDFGGGSMFLMTGILAALIERGRTGKGNVVDAAIIDGTHSLMSFVHGMAGVGQWQPKRESNLLDGAAPFYRCYMTADGKFMAVGCIEPQFFAAMMERLPIDAEAFGAQLDFGSWARQHEMLEDVFATKTRDEWEAIFAGTDACVTPVLDYVEAAAHPANAKRQAVLQDGRWLHPQIAPRLATQPLATHFEIATKGGDYAAILAEAGLGENDISQLIAAGAVIAN